MMYARKNALVVGVAMPKTITTMQRIKLHIVNKRFSGLTSNLIKFCKENTIKLSGLSQIDHNLCIDLVPFSDNKRLILQQGSPWFVCPKLVWFSKFRSVNFKKLLDNFLHNLQLISVE